MKTSWRRLLALRSFALRAMLLMMATAVPRLLAAFGWLSWQSYDRLRDTTRRELTVQAGIAASNASAPMAFGSVAEAEAVLNSLALSPHVAAATLLERSGRVFASFDKRDGHRGAGADEALFRLEAPVAFRSEAIGTIVVYGHFGSMRAAFLRDLGGSLAPMALVALGALLVGGLLARRLTAPLGALARLMDRIAAERDWRLRAEPRGDDEVARLARRFNEMVQQMAEHDALLQAELTQRQSAERRYAELAYRDAVTGLPNRRFFTERLERLLAPDAAGCTPHERFALLFVDLDNFKGVNDTLGHDAGDELLRQLALRLRDALRPEDVVCRLGGDEFAVLVAPLDGEAALPRITQRVVQAAREAVALGAADVVVSASVGVAMFPEAGRDASTLLRNADAAMYEAKSLGKNRAVLFTPELLKSATRQFLIRSHLPRAVERGELELHY